MAVIRCPNCGKPNPDFLKVCQYCDAKLPPAGDTPAAPPASAEDTLIRTPAKTPAPPAQPEPEDQGTDWLARLRRRQTGEGALAKSDAADEPDWMWTGDTAAASADTPAGTAAAAPAGAADDSSVELPEWLRDLDEPIDLTPAATAAPTAPAATPPPTITGRAPATPPEAPTPPNAPSAPAAPAAPPTPPGAAVPAARAARTPEPSPFEPNASDVTIPPRPRRKLTDWLEKVKDLGPGSPTAEPEQPIIPNADADLPDWLKAIAADAQSADSAAAAIEAATSPQGNQAAAPTPESELPEWLRALREQNEPPKPVPGTAALQTRPPGGTGTLGQGRRAQELPQNMRPQSPEDTLIPRPGMKPLVSPSDDMPGWLKGILTGQAQEAAPAQGGATAAAPAPDVAPQQSPATPPAAPTAPAETPAATMAAAVTPPASPDATATPEAALAAEQSTSAEAAPVAPGTPTPPIDETAPPATRSTKRMTDWLGKKPAPVPSATPEEEGLPDWLKALSAESTAAPAAASAPAEPLPDWLQAGTPTPQATAPAAAPAAAAQPATPAPAVPELAATPAADLPDWVKAMAPAAPGVEAVPAPVEPATLAPAAAPAASPTAEDDLPDWLKAMAPATAAVEAAPTPAAPEIAATPAAELPDWVKAMAPAAPATPAPPAVPAASPTAEEELPDWLKAMAPAAPTSADAAVTGTLAAPAAATADQTPASTPVPTPPPAEELPDWLKAMPPAALAPTAAAAAETGLPAADVADQVTPAPAATPAAAQTAEEELPDWLKALAPAPAPAAAPAAPAVEAAPAPVEPVTPAPTGPAVPPMRAQPLGEEEDLPEWLKAITQAPAAKATSPSDIATAPFPAPEGPAPTIGEAPAEYAAVAPGAPAPAEEEDLPDWLKAITAASAVAGAEATKQTTPTAAFDATASDAATTLVGGAPALAQPAAQALATEEPGAPAAPTAEQPLAAAEGEPGGATLPPWLAGVGTGPLPDMPELDAETLAWLAEAQKTETTPEPAGLDLTTAKLPPEKPAWLDELAAVTAAGAATPAPAGAAADAVPEITPTPEEALPDWLKALRGQAAAEEASPESMPDWLRALRSTGAPATATATSAAAGTPSAPWPPAITTTAAVPAAAAPAGAAAVTTPPAAGAETPGLEQAALPAWLAAMRPVDIGLPAATESDSYQETLGVLAGMRGVLRAEPVVAQPHKAATPVHSLAVSDTHTAHAGLLTELLRVETAVQPVRRRGIRWGALVERWVVFGVLLAALVLAQFQTQLHLPAIFGLPPAALPPEAAAVYSLVEGLPKGKPALVAFDYEAAQAGELSPGAQAVIGHLARHGSPVAAVSLQLTGAAVAEQLLSGTASSGYVNLGYIPGGPVGLLQFAADPRSMFKSDFSGNANAWSTPAIANIHALSDFGLIVLVSGAAESTRAWMEQAQSFAGDVPTVAIISAGAEPMVRPYYDDPDAHSALTGQLPIKGLVVGLAGAAAYERATYSPGAATTLWPALGGGLLAAALIIAVGNLFFAMAGRPRRPRGREG